MVHRGLYTSADRVKRLKLIADYLLQADLEVVGLQEVWIRKDYDEMVQRLKQKFPYSYSFKWY